MSGLNVCEVQRDGYLISTDPARLDANAIHAYLDRSYWAAGRAKEIVRNSLAHSLCFGLYRGDEQVGLCRVITDMWTYAYLCDVYVLETHQGRGLGKWLIETVTNCPELSTVNRWSLLTGDAHGLYAQFGFAPVANPERYMEMIKQTNGPVDSHTIAP